MSHPHHAQAKPTLALVGAPNCGKTSLFNQLTGARQKVGNYAGVTVEKKSGLCQLASGWVGLIDLPGTYSLHPNGQDEQITCQLLLGQRQDETLPDALVVVVDATNLELHLSLVLELLPLGWPMVVALNMSDLAQQAGWVIDEALLSQMLGVPVVATVGTAGHAPRALLSVLEQLCQSQPQAPTMPLQALPLTNTTVAERHQRIEKLIAATTRRIPGSDRWLHDERWDRVLMHPLWGPVVLVLVLAGVFQAVFSLAAIPSDALVQLSRWAADASFQALGGGPLAGLISEGVITGGGIVLGFLPQILVLMACLGLLEDSGYLPRAAFLLDRLMGRFGLSGRALIPMLSGFACAIPAVVATRTMPRWHDRLVSIMVIPLLTCSARLPVYTLLIGVFVPATHIGPFSLQGLVLLGLYGAGVVSALLAAWVLRFAVLGEPYQMLLMELPPYHRPRARQVLLMLWDRMLGFVRRVATIIVSLSILMWLLSNFPHPPPGATEPAIYYSAAGWLGRHLQPLFEPLGFNWQISVALIPGLVAREVMVASLATVYAVSADAQHLSDVIASQWSARTGYALIAWYVFAPQCLSTLAAVRRETNSWRYPLAMAAYLFALAYLAAWLTFQQPWH